MQINRKSFQFIGITNELIVETIRRLFYLFFTYLLCIENDLFFFQTGLHISLVTVPVSPHTFPSGLPRHSSRVDEGSYLTQVQTRVPFSFYVEETNEERWFNPVLSSLVVIHVEKSKFLSLYLKTFGCKLGLLIRFVAKIPFAQVLPHV